MSRTVDERVVEMRFDNQQFERNVSTSMSTLEKLKQSLNLTDSAKGFDSISRAADGVNMSTLGNAVETVRAKFSALEVMAVTALANVTNSAVNAGKRLVSAFTIEPIKTGLAEYETQINAVQTILANTSSKGTNLDDVNGALDELNAYADKTIYNFTEMTRNIGTFTAAGVDLDTSVQAIKGIANLAAVSGSTSQQASTAMYQLSQALSSGTVKLQDWNSVVNAGMGGQVFQDALKETARVHGIAIDDMIASEGSFRETLSKGWLSSEILTETLSKFTGDLTEAQLLSMGYTQEQAAEILKMGETANDAATKVKTFTQLMDTLKEAAQSGWTQTWEILIGDFEEAKELWTGVSDYFSEALNKSAEARNNLLQAWADGGGRTMAIESIKNVFDGLLSVIKPIKEAFRDIFPPMTAERLLRITEAVKNFTEKLKLSDAQAAKVKSAFKGLFSIISIGANFIGKLVSGIAKLLPNLAGIGNGILNAAGSFGDFLTGIKDSIQQSNLFGRAIGALVNIIQNGINIVKSFVSSLKEKFTAPGVERVSSVFEKLMYVLQKIGSVIGSVCSKIGSALSSVFKSGGLDRAMDLLQGGLFTGILAGINKFVNGGIVGAFKNLFDSVLAPLSNIKERVTDVLDNLRGCLEAYQNNLKANILLKIAGAVGILAASLIALAMVDPDKLGGAIGALTAIFTELVGSMAILDKYDFRKGAKATTNMIKIAAAVFILSLALKQIGSMNWGELGRGLVGVTVLLGEVVAACIILSKYGGRIKKCGTQLILIAVALKILASVCKDLSELSWGELAIGLSGVGALLLEIAGFSALMKKIKPKSMISTALSMVLIGAAMEIFADVSKKFGSMEWGELGKAGAAIGAILLLAAGFANLAQYASKMVGSAIALAIIGGAMEIFADVSKKFATMQWEELSKAGAAIGGILILAAGFANLAKFAPKMASSAIALAIIGASMEIFADVAQKFGSMKWEELGKAGAAIGGILILAAGFALLAGLAPGIVGASAALLIMAIALGILAPVLKSLGGMSWEEIAKGLVAIAGAFAIIGIAGLLLGPLIPVILGLSAAIALFGIGCLAVGAGVLMLSIGLTGLAASGTAAAAALVASILIILNGLGDMIVAFCNAIASSAEAIGNAVKAVILTLVDVIVECAPALAEGALALIDQLLTILIEYGPTIVDKLITLILQLLDGLTARMPELIESLKNFIVSVINGLSTAAPEIIAAGLELVGSIIQAIADGLGPLVDQVIAPLCESLGNAIGRIAEGMAPIVESIANAIDSICNAFISLIEQISPIIDSITSLIQQLGDTISQIFQSISDTISTCGSTISEVLGSLSETINSVFSGIGEVITSIGESIKSVLDGIAGIIDSIGNAALNAGTGFENLANGVKTITELNLADVALSMGAVAKGIKDIADNSGGLAEAGTGMQQIVTGSQLSANAFNAMSAGVTKIVSGLTNVTSASITASMAISNLASSFSSMSATVGPVVSGLMSAISSAVTAASGQMMMAFNIIITNLLNSLNARKQLFYVAGNSLVKRLAAGIDSGQSDVNSSLRTLVTTASEKIKEYYDDFWNAGDYLVEGFAAGIDENTWKAKEKAEAMASAAYDAAMAALWAQSPSRLFMRVGSYVAEGFAIGIEDNTNLSDAASKEMADSAVKNASSALSRISDAVSNDATLQPTIRPVVDMASVNATSLDLGTGIDVSFTGSIDSLAQLISGAQAQIDASNREVISAINGLREDLSAIGVSLDNHETSLYVDSKKLASSIAKPMNKQLNILSKKGAYA